MYVLLGIRSAAALCVVPVVMLLLLLLLIIVHLLPRLTLIQKPLVHIYIRTVKSFLSLWQVHSPFGESRRNASGFFCVFVCGKFQSPTRVVT